MRGEDAVRLAMALNQLPEDQAEAIRLRHLEGWTLAAMAAHLNRSESSVAGLIKRGLQKLKTIIIDPRALSNDQRFLNHFPPFDSCPV